MPPNIPSRPHQQQTENLQSRRGCRLVIRTFDASKILKKSWCDQSKVIERLLPCKNRLSLMRTFFSMHSLQVVARRKTSRYRIRVLGTGSSGDWYEATDLCPRKVQQYLRFRIHVLSILSWFWPGIYRVQHTTYGSHYLGLGNRSSVEAVVSSDASPLPSLVYL